MMYNSYNANYIFSIGTEIYFGEKNTMRNKKFLSALLVAILLCSCIAGVLMVRANAAGATWYVTDTADTANNKYGTVQAALDAAKGKTWAAGDTLTIEIQTKTAQKMDETGDILFGIPTIFRADHSRLPITIQGKSGVAASLNVGNLSGSVNCSNSYTFKNLKSDLAIKNLKFYAGSGEVVFDNVDFGVSASNQASTILASDLSTAGAFFRLEGRQHQQGQGR